MYSHIRKPSEAMACIYETQTFFRQKTNLESIACDDFWCMMTWPGAGISLILWLSLVRTCNFFHSLNRKVPPESAKGWIAICGMPTWEYFRWNLKGRIARNWLPLIFTSLTPYGSLTHRPINLLNFSFKFEKIFEFKS